MRHVFVVNPCAGRSDASGYIRQRVADMDMRAEVHTTRQPLDAKRFVAAWLAAHKGEAVRFYACGGDGTLNEVVAGIMGSHASGAEVACYPCGSGNDFIKYYGGGAFASLEALAAGRSVPVDEMRLGDRYCVNTLNYGFEAAVCHAMGKVRRLPLAGGRMAYTTGIITSLATARRNRCRVTVDGEAWIDGEVLLLSLANGMYAGGGYKCAPRARNDDGLLEVTSVKPMSIARFAQLIKYYKNGELLDRDGLRSVVSYRRGRRVVIEADGDAFVATDGEIVQGCRFEVECLKQAVNFVLPEAYKADTLTS